MDMHHLLCFKLWLILLYLPCGHTDPCNELIYKQIPYAGSRYVKNVISPGDGDPILGDRELPEGWYRAGDETMPTNPPPLFSCGTVFPMWFDDSLPVNPGTEENMKRVCQNGLDGPCSSVQHISVKNCGGYFVYKLSASPGQDSAYCFGEGVAGARPNYTPQGVTVTVELDNTLGISGVLLAKCNFQDDQLNPGVLLYQVTWLFDDNFGLSKDTVPYSDRASSNIILDETNIKSLGKTVSCSVVAKTVDMGPPGRDGKSEQVFVGIEVLTPIVKFKRGGTGEIRIRPTVGIGCIHSNENVDYCKLSVRMVNYDTNKCSANVGVDNDIVDQETCSKEILASEWSKNHSIIIQAREEEYHYYSATYTIELITDKHGHHPIWEDYRLPDIIVQIEEATATHWSTKYCQAQDDPHYLTFDKRPFDFHDAGIYTMYRHTTEAIEVQVRQEACGRNNAFCTCGVAVRVGGDVFVIDRCGSVYSKKIKYVSCLDGKLSVHKETNMKYVMYTPLGTRIVSSLKGETFMTVQIFPSLRDVGKTKGLCGTLTNDCKDDFLKSDGTLFVNGDTARECNTLGLTDYKFRPNEFSYSWRVEEGNNLFKEEPTFDGNHWAANKQICICRKDNTVVDGDEYIDCSSSSIVTCNREAEVKTPQTCSSVFKRTWSVPLIQKTRTKRRSPYISPREIDVSVAWTEAEAIEQCTLYMDKSASFKMCKDIPNVDPSIAINTCVLDILLTNSTQWMIDAREGIKGKCLAEVRVNATLQNETESGGASIAEIVKNATCINDCLERGRCENGSCICDDGYGGGDCGIDLSIPPAISGMIDSGLCDLNLVPCTEANLEGDGFTSEGNPNCRIKRFHITLNGSLQVENNYIDRKGDPSTLMTMFCPVSGAVTKVVKLTQDPPFITGYRISVSNDGLNFGDEEEMFIFNSTYQEFSAVDGKFQFTLKNGFCFINGDPYLDGTKSATDSCRVCLPAKSLTEWSSSAEPECRVALKSENSSDLGTGAITGIVIGVLSAIILVTGLMVWKFKSARPKRFNSRVSMHGLDNETTVQRVA